MSRNPIGNQKFLYGILTLSVKVILFLNYVDCNLLIYKNIINNKLNGYIIAAMRIVLQIM